MKICNVEGCQSRHSAKGYCLKHYKRVKRKGSVHSVLDSSYLERFNNRYKVDDVVHERLKTPCWTWTAGKISAGYGSFSVDGKETRAHRYSYELYVGKIPKGLLVRHRCDNPACVNPEHLLLGTDKDNAKDRCRRGRGNEGEKQGNSVLKTFQVIEIFKSKESKSSNYLAQKYKISPTTIFDIWSGRTWSHLTDTVSIN